MKQNNFPVENGFSDNSKFTDDKNDDAMETQSLKPSILLDAKINSYEVKEQPLSDNNNKLPPLKLCLKRPIPGLISRKDIITKRFKTKTSKSLEEVSRHLNIPLENSNQNQSLPIGNRSLGKQLCDPLNIRQFEESTSRTISSQYDTKTATATYSTNQALQITESLKELTVSAHFTDQNPQKSLVQHIHTQRYIEENGIDISDRPQSSVINNSVVPNIHIATNDICDLSNIQSYENLPQPSPASYVVDTDPRVQNLHTRKSTGAQVIDQNSYLESNMNNMTSMGKKNIKGHEKPLLTAGESSLYQDLIERKIFSVDKNQQFLPQNGVNNLSFPQDNCSLQKLINYCCELNIYGNQSSTVDRNDAQQELQTQGIPKTIAEINCDDQQTLNFPKNMTSSPSNFSKSASQYYHLSEPKHKQKVLPNNENFTQENPRASQIIIEDSEYIHKQKKLTSNNNYTQENPLAQNIIIRGSSETKSRDQRVRTQSTKKKSIHVLESIILPDPLKRVPRQTVISSTSSVSENTAPDKQNLPMPENQICQSSVRLCKTQTPPASRNYSLRDPRLQKNRHEIPIQMDNLDQNSQSKSTLTHNLTDLQDCQQSYNHSHKSENVSDVTVIQNQSMCMPKIYIESSSEQTSICCENKCEENLSSNQTLSNRKKLIEKPHQKRQSSIRRNTVAQNMAMKKTPVVKITDVMLKHSEKNNRSESDKNCETKANESSSISLLSKANKEDVMMKILRHSLSKISSSITDILKITDQDRKTTHELNTTIQQALKALDRYRESTNNDAVASTSTNNLENNLKDISINTENKRKIVVKQDKHNFYYDGDYETTDTAIDTEDSDDNFEVPKRCAVKKRSFVLPPEFKSNDSKWTLKYHKAEPGIIELIPHSGVYINHIRLAHCKQSANDYNTLGRLLLVEIFTQNALSVCSLTGARANAFDVDSSDVRPGLDKNARSVILMFVEKHGRKKKWGRFDLQAVTNSIRSKVQEIRAKYGYKNNIKVAEQRENVKFK